VRGTPQDVWGHSERPEADYCSSMVADWRALHRKLVARRCRLVADVQRVYDIQPHTGAPPPPHTPPPSTHSTPWVVLVQPCQPCLKGLHLLRPSVL